ncbi:protein OSB1, mitochondrial-like isoform X2 [Asparagus officinalis]|nr:protein OSB1, mitochondrial-like isoform X2 [Asparagus officinalis]XP_020276176.1 protein OSB1, mitochondrial-like isoform X2 [Asparagus officinalis]XP_020276177.1 protein OSB1, mitochondrial-like isoform X2 [Asparagus officinalis]
MRGKLSEISLRHLEPNDYIYVSGALSSYKRVDAAGKCDILYKVAVSELNIVTRQDKNQVSQKSESAVGSLTEGTSCEPDQEKVLSDNDERYRDRLRLWQVFFANPHEWWDNRQDKRNPGSPDFKHKDTKECLWLNPDDPPWIRKQLQLYDSSMGIRHHSRQDAFEWKAKDFI